MKQHEAAERSCIPCHRQFCIISLRRKEQTPFSAKRAKDTMTSTEGRILLTKRAKDTISRTQCDSI